MNDEGMTPDDILHLARGLRVDATPGFTRAVMTRVSESRGAAEPWLVALGRCSAVYAGLIAGALLAALIFGTLPISKVPAPTAEASAVESGRR